MSASGRKVIVVPVSLVARALLQVAERLAALVGLGPDEAVAPDLDVEALGQRVDDRDADAVQAAGDLVAAAVAELAAGVQHGQHDLDRRALLLLHDRDRDAAAVVGDGDRVVGVDRDRDVVAVAGQRLVDRVVDNLVDEVVQAARPGRADVHARALADRLEALEDGDVLGVVTGRFCWRALRRRLSVANDPPMTSRRPGIRATCGAPGRRKLVYRRIAQRPPEPARQQAPNLPAKRRKMRATARATGRLRSGGRDRRLSRSHRDAPQTRRPARPSSTRVQALEDRGRHQVELLRPDRRRARRPSARRRARRSACASAAIVGPTASRPDAAGPRPAASSGRQLVARAARARAPSGRGLRRWRGHAASASCEHAPVGDREPRHPGVRRRPGRARGRWW